MKSYISALQESKNNPGKTSRAGLHSVREGKLPSGRKYSVTRQSFGNGSASTKSQVQLNKGTKITSVKDTGRSFKKERMKEKHGVTPGGREYAASKKADGSKITVVSSSGLRRGEHVKRTRGSNQEKYSTKMTFPERFPAHGTYRTGDTPIKKSFITPAKKK